MISLQICNMQLIRLNPYNRSIPSMQLWEFLHQTRCENIMICVIQSGCGSKLWSGKFRERMEIQTIYRLHKNIPNQRGDGIRHALQREDGEHYGMAVKISFQS